MKREALALWLCLAGVPLVASATETVNCVGEVKRMSSRVPDGFHMQLADSGYMKVCSPESARHNVSPQNCRHMASLAALAYATGKDLTVRVRNAPSAGCSSIPDGHDAHVDYVGIEAQ